MEHNQKLTLTLRKSHASAHQIQIIGLTIKIWTIEKVNAITTPVSFYIIWHNYSHYFFQIALILIYHHIILV